MLDPKLPRGSCRAVQVRLNREFCCCLAVLYGGEESRGELPSTITYSQEFRGTAQRKSAQTFCRVLWLFSPVLTENRARPQISIRVTMLQASPHVLHFKYILDFGEGKGTVGRL